MFHVYLGPCGQKDGCDHTLCTNDASALKTARSGPRAEGLRRFMLVNGVDIQGAGGMLSSAHTLADVEQAVGAFDRTLENMAAAGLL